VAVTGAVGSGKSTLLAAIAGAPHVAVLRGHVVAAAAAGGDTPPVISLAAQQPWLFSGTLRDNVVCGQPFDAERYAAVLEALESAGCARTWSAPSVPPRRNGYNRRRGDAWASGHHGARNLVHT
jgi:ABC-type multidrug transport system fused ATPase/permease subunit